MEKTKVESENVTIYMIYMKLQVTQLRTFSHKGKYFNCSN